MKAVLVFCALLAFTLAADEEWKPISEEDHKKLKNECLKEFKVPEPIAEKVLKYEFDDDNEALRCAVKCVFERNGLFDSATGYNVDRIYEQALFKGSIVTSKDDLKTCIGDKQKDEDDCGWAYRNFKCMFDSKFIIPKKA